MLLSPAAAAGIDENNLKKYQLLRKNRSFRNGIFFMSNTRKSRFKRKAPRITALSDLRNIKTAGFRLNRYRVPFTDFNLSSKPHKNETYIIKVKREFEMYFLERNSRGI